MTIEINPQCEHRFTEMETIISNHIPHVESRLQRIEKMLWGIAISAITGIISLILFLAKGHIKFGP